MSLTLQMILPDRRLELRGLVSVVFQSMEGEVCILGGHAPLVCEVQAGTLCATEADHLRQRFVTGQGLARIASDCICLLLMDLIAEDEIDAVAAKRLLQRARAESAAHAADDPESAGLIRFAEAQLSMAGNGTV
jgi:F0F1-type ATP synthase epsilon subunit